MTDFIIVVFLFFPPSSFSPPHLSHKEDTLVIIHPLTNPPPLLYPLHTHTNTNTRACTHKVWVDTSQLLPACFAAAQAIVISPRPGAEAQITALALALRTLFPQPPFLFSLSPSPVTVDYKNLIRAFKRAPISGNPIPENNYDIPGIKSLVMSISLGWKI